MTKENYKNHKVAASKSANNASVPRKALERQTCGQNVIRKDLFDFYKSERPNSTVVRLIEERRLAAWHSDMGATVVFVKAPLKDIEMMLAEIAMMPSDKYKIDTRGRKLDGMSFRAEDSAGMTYYVLALPRDYSFRDGMPLLAHEATHIAVKLLTDHELTLDVDPKDGKAEPLAYLIGSLVEFGMDTLWPDKNGYPPIGPIEGMIDNVRQEKKSAVAVSH